MEIEMLVVKSHQEKEAKLQRKKNQFKVKKCVFFQAEDSIRDLVRSRGLGDVYKRQDVG